MMNHKYILGSLLLVMIFWLPLAAQQEAYKDDHLPDASKTRKDFQQKYLRWQHSHAVDLIKTEDYAEALQWLDRVIADSGGATVYYNRSIVHRRMNNHSASMEDIGKGHST